MANLGKFICSLICFCLIVSSCYSKKPAGTVQGFAVVELFTSEGCSSCPAAEATLQQLKQLYGDNLYILEFHVDYWNNLGWKDIYSSAEYTARQQQYVAHFNQGSAYTPQAIVNGSEQLVGSDKSGLQRIIDNALLSKPATAVSINAAKKGDDIEVAYKVTGPIPSKLNFALVQKDALTDVKRGENGGRKLHHTNVVRVFNSVTAAGSGTLTLHLPNGVAPKDCLVIAYAQQTDGTITAATQAPLL